MLFLPELTFSDLRYTICVYNVNSQYLFMHVSCAVCNFWFEEKPAAACKYASDLLCWNLKVFFGTNLLTLVIFLAFFVIFFLKKVLFGSNYSLKMEFQYVISM